MKSPGLALNRAVLAVVLVLAATLATGLGAQTAKPLAVGMALGYPPYQFSTEAGEPTGIDADVTRLVFKELGLDFRFVQKKWDDVYLKLVHKTGEIDLLCGAEINTERQALFDFSKPYYSRASAIFVLADSPVKGLDDMKGKIMTGDRDSFFENQIEVKKIRVLATNSKEESFQFLKAKKVDAVIAPLAVGQWVAKQMGLQVRILPESAKDTGSPVAFAVAKGNTALADKISQALATLAKSGQIDAIIKKYQ